MNWCFIGAGRLADKVAKAILPSGRHEIVTVYSRRAESREAFGKKWGAMPCPTPEEAIAHPSVEAVYVVTPHDSHFAYAKLALELGKPVLVEKPFTVAAVETDALITLAREKKLYLAEAMWTWFSPVAHQVKRWVDAGELGRIHTARFSYAFLAPRDRARLFDPERAGGALLDIGVYPITYLYRLFGTPVDIQCQGKLDGGVDLSEDISFTFQNGLTAQAFCSIVDDGPEQMTLEGDKGSIHCALFHSAAQIELHRAHGETENFQGDGGYLNEFDAVAGEITDGRTESALVPLSATSDVMHMMDECRCQMGLRYPFEADAPANRRTKVISLSPTG